MWWSYSAVAWKEASCIIKLRNWRMEIDFPSFFDNVNCRKRYSSPIIMDVAEGMGSILLLPARLQWIFLGKTNQKVHFHNFMLRAKNWKWIFFWGRRHGSEIKWISTQQTEKALNKLSPLHFNWLHLGKCLGSGKTYFILPSPKSVFIFKRKCLF